MKFLRRRLLNFRVSNILDVLWPNPDFWYTSDQPGLLDKHHAPTVLEVEAAADVVLRLSRAYNFSDVRHVAWSSDELRDAAEQMGSRPSKP